MGGHGSISIWFFIGVLLDIYGIAILIEGIRDLMRPPATPVVLAELHAGVWWGAFMIVLGVVYTIAFRPRKSS
jgi:hypothetical protein